MYANFILETNTMATSLTIRMDETLKSEAEEFFGDIGMNLTTAITCYFKKCLAVGEIPFKLGRKNPHERLLEIKREAEEIALDPHAPRCTDAKDLHDFLFA